MQACTQCFCKNSQGQDFCIPDCWLDTDSWPQNPAPDILYRSYLCVCFISAEFSSFLVAHDTFVHKPHSWQRMSTSAEASLLDTLDSPASNPTKPCFVGFLEDSEDADLELLARERQGLRIFQNRKLCLKLR